MFASTGDVRGEYEGVIPSSRDQWLTAKITAAENLLISRIPSIATTADAVRLANAKTVVVAAVLRVYRNPSGAKQESASVYGVTRAKGPDSGLLYFEEDELASVRPKPKRRRYGTIPTTPWRVDVYGR